MRPYKSPLAPRAEVVFFGGGGGIPGIAQGFIETHPGVQVAVIMAMADRGGSTGRLLEYTDGLPVGDMTMAFAAVSGSPTIRNVLNGPRFTFETTPNEIALLNSRFVAAIPADYRQDAAATLEHAVRVGCILHGQGSLAGHSYRNMTFMSLMQRYHDVMAAADIYGKWVGARARIIPATDQPHYLVLKYRDAGEEIEIWGEDVIDDKVIPDINAADIELRRVPGLNAPQATRAAVDATKHASVVVVGPGSPVTSLGPSFKYDGLLHALHEQTVRGNVFVVSNLCPERTTPNLTVTRLVHYLRRQGLHPNKVLVNNAQLPGGRQPLELSDEEYEAEEDMYIRDSLAERIEEAIDPHDAIASKGNRSPVRHDTKRVAALLDVHALSLPT